MITLRISGGDLWVNIENEDGSGGSDYISLAELAQALEPYLRKD